MNKTDKTKNSPSANYAMYELDRVAKREAQKASGKPELPQVIWSDEHCNNFGKQAQSSPLPWEHNATKAFTDRNGGWHHGYACAIWQGDNPIATTEFSVGKYKALSPEQQDANAKLIVASVNHADKLAEALREAADWLDRSTRIDDREQASDARAALAAWEQANSS